MRPSSRTSSLSTSSDSIQDDLQFLPDSILEGQKFPTSIEEALTAKRSKNEDQHQDSSFFSSPISKNIVEWAASINNEANDIQSRAAKWVKEFELHTQSFISLVSEWKESQSVKNKVDIDWQQAMTHKLTSLESLIQNLTENIKKLGNRIKDIQYSQSSHESLLNHTLDKFNYFESLYRKSQHLFAFLDRQSLHDEHQRNNGNSFHNVSNESHDYDNSTSIEDYDTTLVREDDDGETMDYGFIPQVSSPNHTSINSNNYSKTHDKLDVDRGWLCDDGNKQTVTDFLDMDTKCANKSCRQTRKLNKRIDKQSMRLNSQVETVLPKFTEEEILNFLSTLEHKDDANSTITNNLEFTSKRRLLLSDSDDEINYLKHTDKKKKLYATITQE